MTTDAVGGVWQYSFDLAKELVNRGAEIALAVMGPAPSRQQAHDIARLAGVQCFTNESPLEWMQQPWSDVDAGGRWLLKLHESFGADVIHLNGYCYAALPWAKPCVSVAHSCVCSWWRAVHGISPGPQWAEYRTRVAEGLRGATEIVAPSMTMGRNLQADYEIPFERIRVISNFSKAPVSYTKKEPFVMAAGRIWDEAKNLHLLEEIRPRLSWDLHIADGTWGHTDLLRNIGAASIFAHPALYEPFGLSILEAARAGCALVLSDIPSLRELWHGAASFVDPHDASAWTSEVNRLAHDQELRERLGQMALHASQRYTAEHSISRYWDLYKTLTTIAPARSETAA